MIKPDVQACSVRARWKEQVNCGNIGKRERTPSPSRRQPWLTGLFRWDIRSGASKVLFPSGGVINSTGAIMKSRPENPPRIRREWVIVRIVRIGLILLALSYLSPCSQDCNRELAWVLQSLLLASFFPWWTARKSSPSAHPQGSIEWKYLLPLVCSFTSFPISIWDR